MANFTETLDATFTGIRVNAAEVKVATKYRIEVQASKKWNIEVKVDKKIKPRGE